MSDLTDTLAMFGYLPEVATMKTYDGKDLRVGQTFYTVQGGRVSSRVIEKIVTVQGWLESHDHQARLAVVGDQAWRYWDIFADPAVAANRAGEWAGEVVNG